MKKAIIIISVILIIAGLLIAFIALLANGFSFGKMTNRHNVTKNYTVSEEYQSIKLDDESGFIDVTIEKSTSENTEITYFGMEEIDIRYTVNDGKLFIECDDSRAFFKKMFSFGTETSIKISVPEKEYGFISIETSSGDVKISKVNMRSLEVDSSSGDVILNSVTVTEKFETELSSGDVKISDSKVGEIYHDSSSGSLEIYRTEVLGKIETELSSGELEIDGSTVGVLLHESSSGDAEIKNCAINSLNIKTTSGEVLFEGVIVSQTLTVKTNSGEVELYETDAQKISVDTTSGEVEGRLLSPKMFDVRTTSGEVRIPASESGSGECIIRTTSGDVEIKINPIER